jgi:hypothetical protein
MSIFLIKIIRISLVLPDMLVGILILELNKVGEMIWKVLVMSLFTFLKEVCLGRISKVKTEMRSMKKSRKKRYLPLLMSYVGDCLMNFNFIYSIVPMLGLKISLIIIISGGSSSRLWLKIIILLIINILLIMLLITKLFQKKIILLIKKSISS